MDSRERELYQFFEEAEITDYTICEHEAVFTVEEAESAGFVMLGLNFKNLFLKDRKTGKFYLVVLDDHRRLDWNAFAALTGWSSRVRFALPEELAEILGLEPGSVSPFGLIYDRKKQVTVVLDQSITKAADTVPVNFHPNRNTATLSLSKKAFLRFLNRTGNPVIYEE